MNFETNKLRTVYCIALAGEATTGSEWFFKREDRDAAKGTTGAEYEIYFTMEVDHALNHEEITVSVDRAEWDGTYTPEMVDVPLELA